MNNTPRTAITITVNLTCGSSCIQHTYRETSILEINRQENAINEISILTVKKHRYSQTSDVVIRYFYGVKKPVFYFCENKEIGSIEGTNLKLCSKSYHILYNNIIVIAITDKTKDLSIRGAMTLPGLLGLVNNSYTQIESTIYNDIHHFVGFFITHRLLR